MAHVARSGWMQCVPQMRAPRAGALITSIATEVAVLTVLVSALAVPAGAIQSLMQAVGFRLADGAGPNPRCFIVDGLWATSTRPGHPMAWQCSALTQLVEQGIAAIPCSSGRKWLRPNE